MTNKDKINQNYNQFANNLQMALENKSTEDTVKAFSEFAEIMQKDLLATAEEFKQTADTTVLTARGIRQLTNAEQSYYGELVKAWKSTDPKQALNNLKATMPQTLVDTITEEIIKKHPLLEAIGVTNTFGNVKWLYSTADTPLAGWGEIGSRVATELTATINVVEFSNCKISAFIPVPQDILTLGANYIDSFVRAFLVEGIAYALEQGVVNGTGKNQPIGMTKDLAGSVTLGVYSDKESVAVTSFDTKPYCELCSRLAVSPNGGHRNVNEVVLVVNPVDYLAKVRPASLKETASGEYAENIFPVPTKVVTSSALEQGTAILGLADKYLLTVANGNSANITYSDDAQFLDDVRVYKAKFFGYGTPKDNNAFIKLDISGLTNA